MLTYLSSVLVCFFENVSIPFPGWRSLEINVIVVCVDLFNDFIFKLSFRPKSKLDSKIWF